MKFAARLTIILALLCVYASAQTAPDSVIQTTVCDLIKNPVQYKGRLVRVRAQMWPQPQQIGEVWMTDSPTTSGQIGKVCGYLAAKFRNPSDLTVSTAFGTFTGRVVENPAFDQFRPRLGAGRSRVQLLVEQESDVYQKRNLNGPVSRLVLLDQTTHSFVAPQ
jgi:hypothetical protein